MLQERVVSESSTERGPGQAGRDTIERGTSVQVRVDTKFIELERKVRNSKLS